MFHDQLIRIGNGIDNASTQVLNAISEIMDPFGGVGKRERSNSRVLARNRSGTDQYSISNSGPFLACCNGARSVV